MDTKSPLSILPDSDQSELIQLIKQKLATAEESRHDLLLKLNDIEVIIRRYRVFLGLVEENEAQEETQLQNVESGPDAKYDKNWTQAQKILYVLRRPFYYTGEATFVGAGSVVKAILKEEPESKSDGNAALLKKFGPILSRMARSNEVVKWPEALNKARVHYLSTDWFEHGLLKPQYRESVVRAIGALPRVLNPKPQSEEVPNATELSDEEVTRARELLRRPKARLGLF